MGLQHSDRRLVLFSGSCCVSPCVSSTALALFSSAELRQRGATAYVPPPILLMSTALINQAAGEARASKRPGWSASFSYPNTCQVFSCLLLPSSGS